LPRITFLGVGDASCPEGASTSILYAGRQTILVDCGPTVPQPLCRVLPDPDALDAIWITHQHADHCFGLPTLLLSFRLAGRKRTLQLLGGQGSIAFLRAILELGYPGSFNASKCYPISFSEIEPERIIVVQGLKLSTARTQHRVSNHALRIDDGDLCVCVSGDGKMTAASLRLCRQADLVIHECQWAAKVTEDHCCVSDVCSLCHEANVSRIAVVHCNNHERAVIADEVSRNLGERAWLPVAGETCTV